MIVLLGVQCSAHIKINLSKVNWPALQFATGFILAKKNGLESGSLCSSRVMPT